MRGITFVASLFVGTLCCLLLGGMALYERVQFWNDGQTGVMISDDPVVRRFVEFGQSGSININVTYITSNGEVQVPQKTLTESLVKRLANGEKVPVTFLGHNPQRVNFDNKPLPSPWGFFLGGAVLLVIAIYAWRLLRKEMGAPH